jgi:cytolysin (calcineurin-like family phosphatase)
MSRPRRINEAILLTAVLASLASAGTNVTFLATSDAHYDAFENEDRNERVRATLRHMNEVATLRWPEPLGGDPIAAPRGAVVLGDLIDDGDRLLQGSLQSEPQWRFYAADFGLDGTDGLLKYPVFEGWGNHDGPPVGAQKHGFSLQEQLKKRNLLRKQKGLVANLSDNGLHYSWDWDAVHLVQLNLYPGDKPHPRVKYSPVWHDPQGALAFLKQDLEKQVGKSGRPVVLLSHYGFDCDWWHRDDWKALYDAVKPYNVVAYFHGHTGTQTYKWKPDGEEKPLTVINTGQTENGFFIVQLTDERLRLAYRCKQWKTRKDEAGKPQREWEGAWEWRFLLIQALKTP